MIRTRLRLKPIDSLMFRDGRPFNQDDEGRAKALSLFPPPMNTVFGAVRVAFARRYGWTGVGDWTDQSNFLKGYKPNEIQSHLGDFNNEEKGFRICGFALEYKEKILWPAPQDLVFSKGKLELRLGTDVALQTDAGVLRNTGSSNDATSLAGRWLSRDLVIEVLQKEVEISVQDEDCGEDGLPGFALSQLVSDYVKVGIERDNNSRHVVDGRLFVEARKVLRSNLAMIVDVECAGVGPLDFPSSVRMGGESRSVWIEKVSEERISKLEEDKATGASEHIFYFQTPALALPIELGKSLSGIGAVSEAYMPRLGTAAGFETRSTDKRQLTKTQTVVPAGTVLILKNTKFEDKFPLAFGENQNRGWGNYFCVARKK